MTNEQKEWIEAYSPEMESTVLACMLNSEEHFHTAKDVLTAEDFYESRNRRLFLNLISAQEQKGSIDLAILIPYLKEIGEVSSDEYNWLIDLNNMGGRYHHIEAYCNELRQFSIKRAIVNLNRDCINDLKDGVSPSEILQRIADKAGAIKESKPNADSFYRPLLEPISEQEIIEEIRGISPGVRIGFKLGEVDLQIPGGALSIIAAPTGQGKTLFIINAILNYLELNPDGKAFFFSYEESRASILSLFLNTYLNLPLSQFNRQSIKSYFRDGQSTYIAETVKEEFKRKKQNFFKTLIDSGRLNIVYSDYAAEELTGAINFLRKNSSVGLIGIDYVQLLRSRESKGMQRQEELKKICLMLKDSAVATGLPLILAAQFNRSVVNEATISPVAIGEAGDIERAANMIIGLWNRNYDGLTEDGNRGKNKKPIPKEPAIYLELLKGRETGIGYSGVFDLNGNTGKLSSRINRPVS